MTCAAAPRPSARSAATAATAPPPRRATTLRASRTESGRRRCRPRRSQERQRHVASRTDLRGRHGDRTARAREHGKLRHIGRRGDGVIQAPELDATPYPQRQAAAVAKRYVEPLPARIPRRLAGGRLAPALGELVDHPILREPGRQAVNLHAQTGHVRQLAAAAGGRRPALHEHDAPTGRAERVGAVERHAHALRSVGRKPHTKREDAEHARARPRQGAVRIEAMLPVFAPIPIGEVHPGLRHAVAFVRHVDRRDATPHRAGLEEDLGLIDGQLGTRGRRG